MERRSLARQTGRGLLADGHELVPGLVVPLHLDVGGVRPDPAGEDDEEPDDGVEETVLPALGTYQLTGLRHQYTPGGSAQETQDLRVNAEFLGPDLHPSVVGGDHPGHREVHHHSPVVHLDDGDEGCR